MTLISYMKNLIVQNDIFSHGQITSKIWLCEELEKRCWIPAPSIFVLGGWQGMLSFLLLSRNNLSIKKLRSFDVDPSCEVVADAINNNWLFDGWKFKAVTQDCNSLDYTDPVDIVINTSTEHFESLDWFDNIPAGTLVCLQGNDLDHDDHHSIFCGFDEFKNSFKFSTSLFEGTREFVYPDFSFTRYMIIGIK